MQLIIKRFIKAEKALKTTEIAFKLDLPITVVQSSLIALINIQMIIELKVLPNTEVVFQPARDINRLTIYDVIDALEKQGENQLPNMNSFSKFSEINTIFDEKIRMITENDLLKERYLNLRLFF